MDPLINEIKLLEGYIFTDEDENGNIINAIKIVLEKKEKGAPTYSDAIEWARKEVIDDARKWFADYPMDIGYPDDWLQDSLNIKSGKERFIKAMEG